MIDIDALLSSSTQILFNFQEFFSFIAKDQVQNHALQLVVISLVCFDWNRSLSLSLISWPWDSWRWQSSNLKNVFLFLHDLIQIMYLWQNYHISDATVFSWCSVKWHMASINLFYFIGGARTQTAGSVHASLPLCYTPSLRIWFIPLLMMSTLTTELSQDIPGLCSTTSIFHLL